MQKEIERDRDKIEKSEKRKTADGEKPPIDNRNHEGMPAHTRRGLNAKQELQDYLEKSQGPRPSISLRRTANGGGRR